MKSKHVYLTVLLICNSFISNLAYSQPPYDDNIYELERQITKAQMKDDAETARQYEEERKSMGESNSSLFTIGEVFPLALYLLYNAYLNQQAEVSKNKYVNEFNEYEPLLKELQTTEKQKGAKLSQLEYFDYSKKVMGIVETMSRENMYNLRAYLQGDSIISAYITAYPDQPQGYSFRERFAKIFDFDTTMGFAVDPIINHNKYLAKNSKMDSSIRAMIFNNNYYLLIYYTNPRNYIPLADRYKKVIETTEYMKTLFSDPDHYRFADKTNKQFRKALARYEKSHR